MVVTSLDDITKKINMLHGGHLEKKMASTNRDY